MSRVSAGSATGVALLIVAYAAVSLVVVTMLPGHGASLFASRWPVVLLRPLGFLLDQGYRNAFIQSSLVVIVLAAPVLVVRNGFTWAMLIGALALWVITGLGVLSIPY